MVTSPYEWKILEWDENPRTDTFYDVNKPIMDSAGVSQYGLCEAIFQQKGAKQKSIAYCSRTVTNTEIKYAQMYVSFNK